MMKDYYAILEVSPQASLEVINNAYRALVKKYHPDRSLSVAHKEKVTRIMQDINEAYQVLSHELARKQYDEEWRRFRTENPEKPSTARAPMASGLKKLALFALLGVFIGLVFQGVGRLVLMMFVSPMGKTLLLLGLIYFLSRGMFRSRR